MRVAYISHSSLVGGELVLVRLLSALDRGAVEPLAVLPVDGPLRGEIKALGVPVHVLPTAWWIPATHWSAGDFLAQLEGLRERAAALAELLAAERTELVHTNTIVTLEGALAAARLGLPHVWHSRGFFGNGFPPAYLDDVPFFLSIVDLLADAVVCVSKGVEAQTAEVCRLAARPVVYDGFDLDAFLGRPVAAPEVVRARYGIPEGARVVASVGGIQRRKGQIDLVEAVAGLAPDFPDLVVALAGGANDGEYQAAVEARVRELGIGRQVRLAGFEPNVLDLFSIAEAMAHPSHSEGFGLAVLEGMAAGLPVVATRCGGPEEIVEEGVSGLLVGVERPAEMAAALRRLLESPEQARAMGKAAAERARAFRLEATARRMEAVYGEVKPGAVPSPARARLADFVADEVLTRGRLAAPPPSPRNPPPDSWLGGLRKRFGGSTP